ncbi:MAG: MBL fold metallo-hydrolase, partial [Oscillospiraceae bacterium]|nr:MBL fold metallo-hydrolase [Oscillospiraceae bacterium]
MFKLIVLGNNGPYPAKNGACSGYLLQHEDTNILLDLGSGSLSNLISVLSSELESIDAIILTHLHSDHISDISVLRYAIFRTGNAVDKDGRALKIPLYCPPAPAQEYEALCSYAQFDVQPITDGLVLGIGGLTLRFAPMRHPYPVYAVSASTGG